jgi:RNA polymerase sigma factor (sigma-70 family)
MKTSLPALVRKLCRLTPPPANNLSDRDLLRRFAAARDEAAFAALVERHGPMVLGVCRRLLRQEQDAEDAFQATFLVLAKRAGTVRWHDSAGGWLYATARRVAGAARDRAARLRFHERTTADVPDLPAPEADGRELGSLLDEELAHLPERYRAPLLLCYLAGERRERAARRLGLSPRTLDRRLQQGREALRARLARRGLVLSAAVAVALPPGRALALARSASLFAAGDAGAAPATATALAEGLLKGTLSAKLRLAGLVLLALAAAGLGAGLLGGAPAAPPPAEVTPPPDKEARADAHGDPLPPGALARLGTVRWHHGGALTHLAFGAGGKQIITAGPDGLLRAWDVANGKELRRLGRAAGPPSAVAFTPDGSRAALADPDGTVRVWDVASGKEVAKIASGLKDGPVALALSPDGKKLASRGADRSLVVWDGATGKELRRLGDAEGNESAGPPGNPIGGGETLCFSPDGKLVAASFADLGKRLAVGVRLWDVGTGESRLHVADRHRASGEEPRERPTAFRPDGKALARIEHGEVAVRDIANGKELIRVSLTKTGAFAEQVAFSPDGKLLAVLTSAEGVCLFDGATGQLIRKFAPAGLARPHRRSDADGRRLAFSPDGKLLAHACGENAVRLCDVETGKARPLPGGHAGAVLAAARTGDDVVQTFGADGTLRRWRADTGKEIDSGPIPGSSGADALAVAPDGRAVAVAKEGRVAVWDVASAKQLRRWGFRGDFPAADELFFSLRLTPGGRFLAGLDYDHRVHVRDVAGGKEFPLPDEGLPPDTRPRRLREVIDYALSPDGRSLLVMTQSEANGEGKGTVTTLGLWDAASGRRLRQWTGDPGPGRVTFSPSGWTVVQTTASHVILWEAASGKERRRFRAPGGVAAFSPDGRLLAVAGPDAVRVWDVYGGEEVGRLTGHTGPVLGMGFTPDGRALLTASADSTALVWDAGRLSRRLAAPPADLAPRLVESYWDDLAGGDAGRAFRAVAALGGAPKPTVAWLRDHLKPAGEAELKKVAGWVADLDSDTFETREKATRELAKAGELARPALEKTLAGRPSQEMRRRAQELLARLKSAEELTPEALRQVRAVEVLEHAGTAEARRLLEDLARGGADAHLRREARAALERFGKEKPRSQ